VGAEKLQRSFGDQRTSNLILIRGDSPPCQAANIGPPRNAEVQPLQVVTALDHESVVSLSAMLYERASSDDVVQPELTPPRPRDGHKTTTRPVFNEKQLEYSKLD